MRRFSAVPGPGGGQQQRLPANGDHPGVSVGAVERKAKCLILTETGGRSRQDEQPVRV
jgi:hypothetical protein